MRRATILISLVVAVFSMQACATSRSRAVASDTVLKGVRTVYVEPSLQFYVQRALARELPGVRVVADERDADATLYFNSKEGMTGAETTGIAIRRSDGRSIVIHEGVSGVTFTNEFVSDFIRAWRAANPASS
jgi:hypothetical protein